MTTQLAFPSGWSKIQVLVTTQLRFPSQWALIPQIMPTQPALLPEWALMDKFTRTFTNFRRIALQNLTEKQLGPLMFRMIKERFWFGHFDNFSFIE